VVGLLTGTGTVQRDATNQSLTDNATRAMTDAALMAELRRVDTASGTTPSGPERQTLEDNLRILEAERLRRVRAQYATAVSDGQVADGPPSLPRPPGIPTSEGFQLIPIDDLPPGVADHLPAGQVFELPAASVTPTAGTPSGGGLASSPVSHGVQTAGAASGGAILAGNYQVTNFGFAGAGSDSFGIVAIPRIQPLIRNGSVNPQANPLIDVARPLDSWGHTAMYVRRGGRIEWVRGFGPDMSPGQLPGFVRAAGQVEQGTAAWPGVVENDASMLRSTMARTVEYPVSPELAAQIAGAHPEGPGGVGGSPTGYTARPATYSAADAQLVCTNTNCVGYAVRAGEAHLGGPIGRAGGPSIADVGTGGRVVPNTSGQGQMYGMLAEAEAGQSAGLGTGLSTPPNALGPAVVGRMPASLRYLKWGGRVFLVVGIGRGALEIYQAPSQERGRTATGVVGGFAGGFALGATAGLICGPGAIVCSVVLGLGLGIIGSMAGRSLAEHFYDASQNPAPAAQYTDEMNRAAHNGVVCPSCHAPLSRQTAGGTRMGSGGVLATVLSQTGSGALGGREGRPTAEDIRVIQQWLGQDRR